MTFRSIQILVFGLYLQNVKCQNYPVWQLPSDAGQYISTISEDTPSGTSIYELSAYDPDGHTLNYYILSGAKFTLDSRILKTNGILNKESDGTHIYLNFRIRDSLGDNLYRDRHAYVTLTDVNDNPPVFSPAVISISVAENTGTSVYLTTLSASDSDSGNNAVYSVAIAGGDDTTANKFTLSGTNLYTTANRLNYEDLSGSGYKYTLVITATETHTSTPQFTGTAYVIVQVTAVNEFTPSISGTTPSSVSVSENAAVGTAVCEMIGSDEDDEPNGDLQYTIVGGSGNNGDFAMDKTSGQLYIVRDLDVEMKSSSYQLFIGIKDAASSPRSSTYAMTVTISDVNDNTPTCTRYYYAKEISESTSSSSSVQSLSCSDSDSGTTLSYSITSGNTDTTFSVSSAGLISTAKTLDYDSGTRSYTITVEVTDGTYSTTVTVGVTVSAVNEATPSFSPSSMTVSIDEDTTIGTSILTFAATDTDGSPHDVINYAITRASNSGISKFVIDKETGAIYLAQGIDYESYKSYELQVVATDGGSSTVTGTVTVSLVDVNDNSPVCSPSAHVKSIDESAAVSYEVVSDLSCTDSDTGSNAVLSYVLTKNPDSKFQIIESSGVYKVTLNGALDYETTSFYQLEVSVTDSGTPPLSTFVSITVNVNNDVNEASPVFSDSGQYSVTFSEDTSISTTILSVSATDADTDDTITYAMVTESDIFSMDNITGVLILSQSLDYETADSHTLLVTCTDGSNVVTATVTVSVSDVNEYPQFISANNNNYRVSIDENLSVGTSVFQTNITDLDSGSLGSVTFSILSGDGTSTFSIASNTGLISTAASIDYETQNVYYLIVQAEDGGSPSLTTTCQVVIFLNDLNDNAPDIEPTSYSMSVSEDAPLGITIATMVASDLDSSANNNNVFQYSLDSVSPFAIDEMTGEITINTTLDRESTSSYDLIAVATDQGSPALTTSYTLTISLIDVNDNPPNITGSYDISINEDTVVNTLIMTLVVNDPDSGDNSRLSYSITSGNDDNQFKIDNGLVLAANTFDRETNDTFNLEITVQDNGSPAQTSTVNITISIADINDNYPQFVSNFSFSVDENATVSTSIGTLNATDIDDGNNSALIYSIVTHWSLGINPFTINSSTGEISTSKSLDRETVETYTLWCQVSDTGSTLLSSDINITISLNDVNDNNPVFGGAIFTGTVAEHSPNGTSVLTVAATDADLGEHADILYSINTTASGGSEADQYFTIKSTTGVISIKGDTDRETKSSYSFYVNAIDNGTTALDSIGSVQVTITDINDNLPIFSTLFHNTEVSYLVVCNSYIATLTATDIDIGSNAVISFFSESSGTIDFDTYFSLSASTGEVSHKSTLTTDTKYLLSFGARDGGTPQLTSNVSATVRVDTFTPDDVIIVFYMSITQTVFLSQEATFLSQLTAVYQQSNTRYVIKRWCFENVNTSSIKVSLYILNDNITDLATNTDQSKTFMSASIAQAWVASSNGTPTDRITEKTKVVVFRNEWKPVRNKFDFHSEELEIVDSYLLCTEWNIFLITRVLPYNYEETVTTETPWIETVAGIAVVASGSFLGVMFIIAMFGLINIAYKACKAAISKRRKNKEIKKELDTEVSKDPTEELAPEVDPEVDLFSTKGLYKDDDLMSRIIYRNPAFTGQKSAKTGVRRKLVKDSNYERTRTKKTQTPPVNPLNFNVKFDLTRYRQETSEHPPKDRQETSEHPPKESFNTLEEESETDSLTNEDWDINVVTNRKFDGKAVDPATGRVYEYNTKTNERRWLDNTRQIHDLFTI